MPYKTFSGLVFKTEQLSISTDCFELSKLETRFGILFASQIDSDSKKIINKCNEDKRSVKNKLIIHNGINYWVSKKEYSIYKQTLKEIKNDSLDILLNKEAKARLNNSGNITSKEKNRLYQLAEKLSNKNTIFSKLLMINIYLDLGFSGKVDSIINSIIKNEYISDFFEIEGMYRNEEEISILVIDILKNLKEKFDDQRLVETLIAYLSYGADQNLRNLFLNDFDIPNKLSYVQERVKSVNYAFMYPFVWTPWIEKYSSSAELEIFLNKTDLYKFLDNGEIKYLSSLRSYFPKNKEKRKIILKAYKSLLNTKDPYLKDVKFRLHRNEEFSKFLIKHKISSRPIFVEMRKFYREQISKNENLSYGLYNLIKIGDLREEYFIKALALKNNGL